MAGKILNFGSLNIDYVYSLDHIVREGETESSIGYQVFEGGKGLNQSVALARAGAAVFHAGKIGKEGLFLKEALENSGADCRYLVTDSGANGHAIIQRSAAGENCIILYPGANHAITPQDIDRVLDDFSADDILVCQNEISEMPYLIASAHKRGMRIAWNPSPITDVVQQIDFRQITWLIINEIEGQAITGKNEPEEILQVLRADYPHLRVVLTLGEAGSVYQDAEVTLTQQRYTVAVKDTTAAGDTFLGYFVREASCPDANLPKALRQAAMAAAIAVSREGAMPSIPDYSEVEAALQAL
jgi:ribokinase